VLISRDESGTADIGFGVKQRGLPREGERASWRVVYSNARSANEQTAPSPMIMWSSARTSTRFSASFYGKGGLTARTLGISPKYKGSRWVSFA
jgi:hypothetical protein